MYIFFSIISIALIGVFSLSAMGFSHHSVYNYKKKYLLVILRILLTFLLIISSIVILLSETNPLFLLIQLLIIPITKFIIKKSINIKLMYISIIDKASMILIIFFSIVHTNKTNLNFDVNLIITDSLNSPMSAFFNTFSLKYIFVLFDFSLYVLYLFFFPILVIYTSIIILKKEWWIFIRSNSSSNENVSLIVKQYFNGLKFYVLRYKNFMLLILLCIVIFSIFLIYGSVSLDDDSFWRTISYYETLSLVLLIPIIFTTISSQKRKNVINTAKISLKKKEQNILYFFKFEHYLKLFADGLYLITGNDLNLNERALDLSKFIGDNQVAQNIIDISNEKLDSILKETNTDNLLSKQMKKYLKSIFIFKKRIEANNILIKKYDKTLGL